MVDKLTEQAEEIRGICARLGIELIELGEAAGIAEETMRKYANGYQPASSIAMASLRNVEKLRMVLRDGPRSPKKTDSSSPHGWMETTTLDRTLFDLSSRLLKTSTHDRKFVLSNIRDVLDELEHREISDRELDRSPVAPHSSPASSGGESLAVKILKKGPPSSR